MATNNKITLNSRTGATAAEADANARELARSLYHAIPINESAGQTFKNSFVEEFLNVSNRARKMASEVLGSGTRRPVIPEPTPSSMSKKSKCCDGCCHD